MLDTLLTKVGQISDLSLAVGSTVQGDVMEHDQHVVGCDVHILVSAYHTPLSSPSDPSRIACSKDASVFSGNAADAPRCPLIINTSPLTNIRASGVGISQSCSWLLLGSLWSPLILLDRPAIVNKARRRTLRARRVATEGFLSTVRVFGSQWGIRRACVACGRLDKLQCTWTWLVMAIDSL